MNSIISDKERKETKDKKMISNLLSAVRKHEKMYTEEEERMETVSHAPMTRRALKKQIETNRLLQEKQVYGTLTDEDLRKFEKDGRKTKRKSRRSKSRKRRRKSKRKSRRRGKF